MALLRAIVISLASMLLAGVPLFAEQQPPPTAQSEYVPASPGSSTEQLPAAPLVIAAYAFVWIATMAYVWTIWRRLGKVEEDLKALERKTGARTTR